MSLDVSRSAYYALAKRRSCRPRRQRDEEFDAARYASVCFGSIDDATVLDRRIAGDLADLGEACTFKHVAKLLKTQGLRAIQPKSFVPKTTDSRHLPIGLQPQPALGSSGDDAHQSTLWVGDITYIPLAWRHHSATWRC